MSESSALVRTRSDKLPTLSHAIEELVDRWSDYLRSEYSETTRPAYLKGLRIFLDMLEEWELDFREVSPIDVREFRDALSEEYAPQTVNLWLTSVRRFYAWMIENGIPIANPASDVRGKSRRGAARRHKRDELSGSEILAVLDTCDDDPIGRRDRSILSIMAYCALRTVEVHRSDLDDLQTKDGRLVLWIRGKGHADADDFVVIPAPAEVALRGWLSLRGEEPGALFVSLSNRTKGGRISLRAIRAIVKSRYREAGVVSSKKTTHSLRHSAISSAIRNGAEPLQVQAMARHRSFDTTLGYYHEIGRTTNPAEDLIIYSPNGDQGEG